MMLLRGAVAALLLLAPLRAQNSTGRAIFLANCSFCHAAGGEGGRGPNLTTASSVHGRDTQSLTRVITKGVPGSQMPAFTQLQPDELQPLVAFVQSLSAAASPNEKVPGNPNAGASLFARNRCTACHRINNEGSVYGPDLTRIGAGRSLQYLRESLTKPEADIMPEYQGVVVTLHDGTRVTGVRINEDTFTVQLRDLAQNFRLFKKDEVQSVETAKRSLMPPYNLPAKELDDLVAYLSTLRGSLSSKDSKQAEGIR